MDSNTEELGFVFFQDYRLGVGITSIEMNVANVKKTERRSFEVITPYRLFRYRSKKPLNCCMQRVVNIDSLFPSLL